MKTNAILRSLLPLALLFVPLSSFAVERFEGDLPGGKSRFAIEVPDDWQPGDALIIYNHGFSLDFPEDVEQVETAPDDSSRDAFLERGYSLAAISYGDRGWAMFDLLAEQAALMAEFRRRVGEPGEILLFGGSLGGLVSMKTAEDFAARGEPVSGVLAVCPPLAGARSWDFALDTRLLFDAVCPSSPLPTGSAGIPWLLDFSAIPPNLGDLTNRDTLESTLSIANRIRQCLGFFQPTFLNTSAQLARRAQLKALLNITSDDFLRTNLAYAVFSLADLVQSPFKLSGASAFDNRFVDYGDPAINARVRRVERDPLAAVKMRAASNLRGPFGAARVLVVHTDRDELVVPEHVDVLAELDIDREHLAVAIVHQDAPAHCDFSAPEVLASFDSLRRWIDDGEAPTASSLLSDCQALRQDPDDRCGFDPDATLASLDEKIPPRNLESRWISSAHSGSWFDPDFDGEGLLVEVIDGGRDAVVGWYTYPPAGGDGEQRWIAGLGRITEDGIHVADAFEYRGASFGSFNPADISAERWGEITLAFGGCPASPPAGNGILSLRYAGPESVGRGERGLRLLTQNAISYPLCTEVGISPIADSASRYSGSWFRSGAPGDGWVLQIGADRQAIVGWYTFAPDGTPAWLIGTGQFDLENRRVELTVQRPRGTRFGAGFNGADIERIDWGQLVLSFDSCNSGSAQWSSSEAGWSSGSSGITRLTRVAGTPDCNE